MRNPLNWLRNRKPKQEPVVVPFENFVMWHENEYAKLPPEVRRRGVAILREQMNPTELAYVPHYFNKYGRVKWMTSIGHHLYWGKAVRNLLRENGLTDMDVPTGNLDDVYVCMMEEAAGLRG